MSTATSRARCMIVSLSLLLPARAPAQEELLEYGIDGSSSCDAKPCYDDAMRHVAVQKALLDLAGGPRAARTFEAALAGSGVAVSDLLRLRLVRREGDRYALDFPLFTAADVRRIREVSER